jgi:hypothetical protein
MAPLLGQVLNEYRVTAEKVHLIVRDDESAMKCTTRIAGYDAIHCTAHKIQLVLFN